MQPGAQQPCVQSLSFSELQTELEALDCPRYRAKQIWEWLYRRDCTNWSAMLNLPASLRHQLAERYGIEPTRTLEISGPAGQTRKLLLELNDAETIETVIIPDGTRLTICVSSQVGCRFGCAFCASGQGGFKRNLEPGEIVGQFTTAAHVEGQRPTNLVFMGVGEPMDNYDNVLKAVRILNDPAGPGIGARKITISTCGVVPGIERLAAEGLQVELSVSLHAPDDTTRDRLMPVNGKYGLATLIPACQSFAEQTKRLITFEYTLVGGVNDSPAQARALARLLSGLHCRVNLIPLSPVSEFNGKASSDEQANLFVRTLASAGINATVRSSKGAGLDAACGQLRSRRRAGATNPETHHNA